MAAINVRNLPENVHKCLRIRAARSGRSMEAEVRAILAEVCACEEQPANAAGLQDWVLHLYKGALPGRAVDDLIRRRRREAARE
jgi:plasmid stability protein